MRVTPFSSSFGEESGAGVVGGGGAVHWILFVRLRGVWAHFNWGREDMPKFLEFLLYIYPSIEMSTVWLM
jgi:hypothetical protein